MVKEPRLSIKLDRHMKEIRDKINKIVLIQEQIKRSSPKCFSHKNISKPKTNELFDLRTYIYEIHLKTIEK